MRLFIAIELSDDVRAALREVQAALRPTAKGVRWVEPEQLHLTVRFLGEAADRDVPRIAEGVIRAAGRCAGFDFRLAECGCFPPRGAVRIVWVAATDDSGRLGACVENVEAEVEALGFARESRPFTSHLTIGRVKEDASGGKLRAAVAGARARAVVQTVTGVNLMSSELTPKGAIYRVVAQGKYGGAAGG